MRYRERESERERERECERERERETERQRETDRERQTDRQTDRQTEMWFDQTDIYLVETFNEMNLHALKCLFLSFWTKIHMSCILLCKC